MKFSLRGGKEVTLTMSCLTAHGLLLSSCLPTNNFSKPYFAGEPRVVPPRAEVALGWVWRGGPLLQHDSYPSWHCPTEDPFTRSPDSATGH